MLGIIAASLPESGPTGDPQGRVQAFASNRHTLLILDNFEQLPPAAPGPGDLFSATPTLQLLVTSRAAFGGEEPYLAPTTCQNRCCLSLPEERKGPCFILEQ